MTHSDKSVRTFAYGMLEEEEDKMVLNATHRKIFELAHTAK